MIAWQIFLYIIFIAAFYSLLALGFGLTLRTVKFFNISYGGAFLIGGYMMFLFYRVLAISFLPALLLSVLVSGLYLLLSYKFIFSKLLGRKGSNFILLITSFGLLTATSAVLGMIFGSQPTFVARHLSDIGVVNIFGATLNTVEITTIVSAFIVILILVYIRRKTRFGRAIRAMEDDSEVAELVGIPKDRTLLKVFFISGAIAGLGGIISGLDVGIIPASGLIYMLPIIITVVVGGMQSFWGGVLGAFILAIAGQITILFFGGSWEQAVPFVILIIMLLVRPEGILKK